MASSSPEGKLSRLLLATNNWGKVRELRDLLSDTGLTIVTPFDLSLFLSVDETGVTYEENAVLKARAFALASGLVALADDSGLEVDALGGAPGVRSARYSGLNATDTDNLTLLLGELDGVPPADRTARFVCVVAISDPSGRVELSKGVCEGIIALEPVGDSGFGYDPVFFLPRYQRTMAQLGMEEKNRVSHRARAVRKAGPIIKTFLQEIGAP